MTRSPARAILLGGFVVGVIDGLAAVISFGLRGISPARIGQGIASHLIGRASFSGGIATSLLGWALHFFIATTIAAVYVIASRRLPVLIRRPFLYGGAYGLAAYLVMSYVVVPLTAPGAGGGARSLTDLVTGVLVHVLGVGIPSALAARWAHGA